MRLEVPVELGDDRVVGVADVGLDANPAVGLREVRRALGEPDGRAHANVPVYVREPASAVALAWQGDAEVVQVDLDLALVVGREAARGALFGGLVEVGRALGAEAATRMACGS